MLFPLVQCRTLTLLSLHRRLTVQLRMFLVRPRRLCTPLKIRCLLSLQPRSLASTSPFMHVAEASTTTTGTSGESAEDPFGFGDGDGDEKSSDSTGVSTPDKPTQQVGHSSDSPISPNDSFQTATMSPSSSTSAPKPEERKGTSDTIVHAAAAQFPSLDEPAFTSGDGLFDNAARQPRTVFTCAGNRA